MAITVEELQIIISVETKKAIAQMKQFKSEMQQSLNDVQKPMKQLEAASEKAKTAIVKSNTAIGKANDAIAKSADAPLEKIKKTRQSAEEIAKLVDDAVKRANAASGSVSDGGPLHPPTKYTDAYASMYDDIRQAVNDVANSAQKPVESAKKVKQTYEDVAKLIDEAVARATTPISTGDDGPLYSPKKYTNAYANKKVSAEPQQPRAPDLSLWERVTAQINAKLDFVKQKLASIGLYGKEAGDKISSGMKSAANASEKAASSVKKVSDHARSAGSGASYLGRMLKSMVVSMLFFQGVSAIFGGVSEGMQNMAQASSAANATLSSVSSSFMYLKNSLAAALMPALQALVPLITTVTNALASLFNMIGAVTSAVFGGAATFVKAKKVQVDYAASLGKTGAAAKKAGQDAKGALASFDELNVIGNQAGGADAGGGGAGGIDPGTMFEEVAVPSKIIDAIDTIKEKLAEAAKIFKSGFDVGFINADFEKLKATIGNVGERLKAIFTAPEVKHAASDFANSFIHSLGVISGAAASIGVNLAQMIFGGLDGYLQSNSETIKSWIVSVFDVSSEIMDELGEIAVSIADIFSVFGGEDAQSIATSIITIFSDAFMLVVELALKAGRDIIEAISRPITENANSIKNALSNTIAPISTVMQSLADASGKVFQKIRTTYDQYVSPMFDAFGDGFSQIVDAATSAYNDHIAPVLQQLADRFADIVDSSLEPLVETFIDVFGKIAELVGTVWKNVIAPFVAWFVKNVSPKIGDALSIVGNAFLTVLDVASRVATGILEALGGVIEFLTGVFSGDWEKAWKGIKTVFRGFADALSPIFKGAVNKIIDAVNWLLRLIPEKINSLIRNVNSIASSIGIGVSIPEIKAPQIPKLAKGGVLTEETLFYGGEYAGARTNPEIVAPQSILRETFEESLWNMIDVLYETSNNVVNAIEQKDTNVYLDRTKVSRELRPEINKQNRLRGNSLVKNT